MQILADEDNKSARRVLYILDNKAKMLSAILIGNNVVNISASALTTAITISLFSSKAIGLSTGLLTLFVLIFGEIFPKTIANTYALRMSMVYSYFVKMLMTLLTPFIVIIDGIRLALLRIFKLEENPNEQMTEDEFMGYVDEGHEKGAIEVNHELIRRILPKGTSFDNLTQKDIFLMMAYLEHDSTDLHSLK